MEKELADNKIYLRAIYLVSILIPVVVAILMFFPVKMNFAGDWVRVLPGVHALINSLTVLTLLSALIAVKKGNITIHRSFMMASLILGILFLVSYVVYHSNVESVKFGDMNGDGLVDEGELAEAGASRLIYLGILASHIILSIVVVPFVLIAFYYALSNQVDKHKRIVRYTFPVWLYVSLTGVIVYFMISPYYPS